MRKILTLLLIILISQALFGCHPRQRATFWQGKYKITDSAASEILPRTLEALKDNNVYIRSKALGYLMASDKIDINDNRVINALSNIAIKDKSPHIRRQAITYLNKFEGQLSINTLLLSLRDSNYTVRIQAINSLEKMDYKGEDYFKLLRVLSEKDPYRAGNQYPVRASAQKILSNMEFDYMIQGKSLPGAILPSDRLGTSGASDIPNFYSVPREDDLAVIIGIEKYQNLKTKADFSRNDAEIVKQYLLALGFQERNIEFLIDERATGASIRKAVEAWLPNHAKKNSRIFVYYSGHGAPDTEGSGYIVPYDGDPNYIKITGYPMDRLINSLQKVKSKETILVVDACFSGSGGKSVLAEGTRPLLLDIRTPKIHRNNIAILSSSKMNQISTTYKDMQHGLFTYYFIKSLQEGKLTINDIYDDIKNKVENEAKKMNVDQTPSLIKPRNSIKGDFSLR